MKGYTFLARPAVVAIGLFLLGLLVYSPTLSGGFIADDWPLISAAKYSGVAGLNHDWAQAHFFRPVFSAVFYGEYKLFGLACVWFRVINIALLAGTAACLYGIVKRFANWKTALGAGVLFVLWPTHAETVVWIAGMTDGLAVFFASLAMLFYVEHCQDLKGWQLAAAIAAMILALFTKEAVVILPVPLILFGYLAAGERKPKVVAHAAVFGAVTVAYLAVRSQTLHQMVGGYKTDQGVGGLLNHALSHRMIIEVANAFFPFEKFVDSTFGSMWVDQTLSYCLVGSAILMLYALPRTSESRRSTRWSLALVLLSAVYLGVASTDFGGMASYVLANDITRALGLCLVAAFLVYFFRARLANLWNSVEQWFTPGRLYVLRLFATVLFLATHATILSITGLLTMISYVAVMALVRPISGSQDPATFEKRKQLAKLAAASFISGYLSLILVANLPAGIDWQQSRFSYFASFFAILTFACLGVAIPKREVKQTLIGVAVIGSLVMVMGNVGAWSQSAMLWKQTAALIQRISPGATKITIVTAPSEVGNAIGFAAPGGLQGIADVVSGPGKLKVETLKLMTHFRVTDDILVRQVGPSTFACFVATRGEQGFKIHRMTESLVNTPPLGPGDRLIFIGGQDAQLIPQ